MTDRPRGEQGAATAARLSAVGALLAVLVLAAVLLFSGDGGSRYRLLFETGGQLVPGNQVLVAGQPVGSVDSITLNDDNQAEVEISTDEPLHFGTSAVIRATSLSGIANRYVSLTLGPDNAPELPDGAEISGERTTSAVDLDQLFDIFRKRERRALSEVIRGFATTYAGRGREANETYKYFNPALTTSERLLAELTRDRRALSDLIRHGSTALGAIAERRDQLSSFVANANRSLGAVAAENDALDRSLSALPPAMREANTTFVNLRATLDDLDPLVADSKPATKDLAPFLRRVRKVAKRGVPVFGDLRKVVRRPGRHSDLADILRDTPRVAKRAGKGVPRVIGGLDESQPVIEFARPYAPDLLGWITKFSQATAYYDANGHYARVQPAGINVFDYDAATGELEPQFDEPERQFDGLDIDVFRRCPGAASQPAQDGSSPFLDGGRLGPTDCDPADVPPGP